MRFLPDSSLRVKLLVALVAVAALSAGMVAVSTRWVAQRHLEADVGARLAALTRIQARAVGEILTRQLDTLQSFALSKLVQDAATRAAVDGATEAARAASELTVELREYQATFPDAREVLVTNQQGRVVATTATRNAGGGERPEGGWWSASSRGGAGSVGSVGSAGSAGSVG
ncbi:MAG TPA: hypothetical protein PKU97_18915, partial [Kofleriaceae bacterium]|nr:hypothetical protein [Kofleriaceae bacterium]